jgi:hypothetical protein
MDIRAFATCHRLLLAGIGTVCLVLGPAWGQVPVVNPSAPVLAAPFPMGMQRGTSLELTLTGANLADPLAVLASFPASVTIPTENNNGKDPGKFLVRIEAPADAPIGWHTLRVVTPKGISNFRLFCLDDLPQVIEAGGNNSRETAQAVPVPCVVCGRCEAEKSDFYKISVRAGQQLSFEVLGRRLGSPFDPMLRLYPVHSSKQLLLSDDSPGASKDPRFAYTFKEAGEYVLEVRDVRYQGGPEWCYRLRIGDFPLATTPYPLAAQAGTSSTVTFAGPHADNAVPVSLQLPTEPEMDLLWLVPRKTEGGLPGWPVALHLSPLPEATESEPNDEPSQANRVPFPGAVNGRFLRSYDPDHYVFSGKKGQRVILEGVTQAWHSPTLLYLVLLDAKGRQLAASNPNTEPARIDFTLPEDGDYTLLAEHQTYWGGPEEVYRVVLRLHEPGFELSAQLDRHQAPAGGTVMVQVNAARQDYGGPIEVRVVGPEGASGSATIPAGQTSTLVPVRIAPETPRGGYLLQMVGTAVLNGREVRQQVRVRSAIREALGNLPYPPRHLEQQLVLGVTEPAPFGLEVAYAQPEGLRGGTVPVEVTVTRAEGFDEEVTVSLLAAPPAQGQPVAIPPASVKIPKGQKQGRLELKPAGNAPLGPQSLGFAAQAKVKDKDMIVHASAGPLPIVLPFDLEVNPGSATIGVPGWTVSEAAVGPYHLVDLLAGPFPPVCWGLLDFHQLRPADNRLTVKVTAKRRGGYNGPIALEVRNLPNKVSAAKTTLAEGQTEAEIVLTAEKGAPVGAKGGVQVVGIATGLGNQENASPAFTLTVTP